MGAERDARELIETIQREKTLNGTIGQHSLVSVIQNALNILAEQLYDKSTHFLLELLQNADDNTYECSTPMLNFSYRPGQLRVDCNEVGFSEENVKAICTIGESTKNGVDRPTMYIGEKGIGFKSVFRVANEVWISSRQYKFKFDRRKELGMIAPLWDEFPEASIPGFTSFCMKIADDYDEDELVEDLVNFDPTLLIFLRSIREINVSVTKCDGKVWSTHFSRSDSGNSGNEITTLDQDGVCAQYVVRRHAVWHNVGESKRPGCFESELLLAFPIAMYESTQNVHAFLPIRDYGLKFLLQADFLLTANRKEIDKSSLWNCTLRNATSQAFLDYIDDIADGPFRFCWPGFIPSKKTSSFFLPVRVEIIKKLSQRPVLESWTEQRSVPSTLFYVPKNFTDDRGIPLTLSAHTAYTYLSGKYDASQLDVLRQLHVQTLSVQDFLSHLSAIIELDQEAFQAKPETWHTQLAQALLPLLMNNELKSFIRTLRIVPLKDGQWAAVADNANDIFFSTKTQGLHIPDGLPIRLINPSAEQDIHRRSLFQQLGIKDCDALGLCRLIARMHSQQHFEPQKLGRAQLIAHARFLYRASWRSEVGAELWFASKKDQRCRGSQLYIRMACPTDSPLARVYNQLETKFEFIHDDYLNVFSTDKVAWAAWLTKTFNISHIPRLASIPFQGISPEFDILFNKCHSRDVLWILKENWNYYSRWLEEKDSTWDPSRPENPVDESSRKQLRQYLKSRRVQCGLGLVPLSQTVLPIIDPFLEINGHTPTVAIYDPQNPDWQILRCFGVTVERCAMYYVRCLEALRSSAPQKRLLIHIYEQLKECFAQDSDFIKIAFLERPLIYASVNVTAVKKRASWVTTTECVVNGLGPEFEYPSCKYFFRCLMISSNDTLDNLITKLGFIDRTTTLSDISQLFRDISTAIKEKQRTSTFHLPQPLRRRPIFPIARHAQLDGFDNLAILGSSTSWFIADREHLRQSFQGKAPLLAFQTEDLEEMDGFLRLFDIERRKLSKLVKEQTVPHGLVNFHSSYTSFLQERVIFIQSLVPKTISNRDEILVQLANIQACTASEILQSFTLGYGNTEIEGLSEKGEIASSSTKDMLQLFMTDECISAECPSFDLIEIIANYCFIRNPIHRSLLSIALTEGSLRRIQTTFRKQGVHVEMHFADDADLLRPEVRAKRYAGASGDVPTISSPFNARKKESRSFEDTASYSSDDERTDGIYLTTKDNLIHPDKMRSTRKSKSKNKKAIATILPFSTTKIGDEPASEKPTHASPSDERLDTPMHYLGELMMSRFFNQNLGHLYDPTTHWTSAYRARAGYDAFNASSDYATFTFSGDVLSSHITKFLAQNGHATAVSGILGSPTYHFEVVVTPDTKSTSFIMRFSQLERMRRYRFENDKQTPTNVVILACLSNLHSALKFEFYIDPWKLYASDQLSLHGHGSFEARFDPQPTTKPQNHTHRSSEKNSMALIDAHKDSKRPGNMEEGNRVKLISEPLIVSHTMIAPQVKKSAPINLKSPYRSHATNSAPYLDGILVLADPEFGSAQRYTYNELPEGNIRLLYLLPGSDEEKLRVTVIHVPFESADRYRALSYVWGTLAQTERLWTPEGILSITPNLKAALEHLRNKNEPLTLWVDAISIDQSNAREKAHQIRLLPHIFQRATSVCAFLGTDICHSRAIETLMQIRAKGASDTWPKCLLPVPVSWSTRSVPSLDDSVWNDIRSFFQNSWFRRAWVTQEVVLAASVRIICGKWIVDWNDLLSATETIDREHRSAVNDTMSAVLPWEFFIELARHREWEARQTRWALINLLESFRYLESTLSRDRFFALLGFASDGANPSFEPDYESPFEKVAIKYAATFIKQGKVLQLLYRAGRSSESRFPSWVPDWTVLKPPSLYESSARGKKFSASWFPEPEVKHKPDSDEIEILGYTHDTIEKITAASNTPEQWPEYFREIDALTKS